MAKRTEGTAALARYEPRGVVSKLNCQPYRSGKKPGWIKVKRRARREANRERYKLFEKAQ